MQHKQRTLSFISVALYLVLLPLLAARAAAVAAASVSLLAADSSSALPAAFQAGRPPSSTATLHTATHSCSKKRVQVRTGRIYNTDDPQLLAWAHAG